MKPPKNKWSLAAKYGQKPAGEGGVSLTCLSFPEGPPKMRPAPPTRDWMDKTPDGFAYRCLPLAIANGHAWELLNVVPFEATWNGEVRNGVRIKSLDGRKPYASDHFGSGILTFFVSALFRTSPGYNLFVRGPTNMPKHGICALDAVVEADWSVATFTMNWRFTAPNVTVRFDQDEPFCAFFPIQRATLNAIEPKIVPLEETGEIYDEYASWNHQRETFLKELPVQGTAANERGWEKSYFQGRHPDGRVGAKDHQTKLRLKPFEAAPKK